MRLRRKGVGDMTAWWTVPGLIGGALVALSGGDALASNPGGAGNSDDGRIFISATDARVVRNGLWEDDGKGGISTCFPGSQVEFTLQGAARLLLDSAKSGTIRVRCEGDGSIHYDAPFDGREIRLDGGTGQLFRVTYVASSVGHFKPLDPDPDAVLRLRGISVTNNVQVGGVSNRSAGPRLLFLGDSITAGTCIEGYTGDWGSDSDATRSFATRLARLMDAPFACAGIPGATSRLLTPYLAGPVLKTHLRPDVVVINLGANERTHTSYAYRRDLSQLIDAVERTFPDCRVILLNFMRMTPNRLPDLKLVAAEREAGKCVVFDARRYLVGYSEEHRIHPDITSHDRLAEALAPFIEKMVMTDAYEDLPREQ